MTKKQTELSEELREAVFEAARAGAAEAYTQNTGYVNYFKAMETLLYPAFACYVEYDVHGAGIVLRERDYVYREPLTIRKQSNEAEYQHTVI